MLDVGLKEGGRGYFSRQGLREARGQYIEGIGLEGEGYILEVGLEGWRDAWREIKNY